LTDKVIVRADGSTRLGHGHIFRTLTLAAELGRRGWKVGYVCRDLPGAPVSRIQDAGHKLVLLEPEIGEPEDSRETLRIAQEFDAAWIVVDRYATDERAFRLWRDEGFKVLAIDDICQHPFPVDILLNQNLGAEKLPYDTDDATIRLFGPRYALVRPAYRQLRPDAPRVIEDVRRVMVFMGGSDPDDVTGKVLAALEEIDTPLKIEVVVGSGYPHLDQLLVSSQESRHVLEIHRDLPDLAGPISRADAAISAGGSVTWELCCMGVPMLLVPIASNQLGIVDAMDCLGAAIRLDCEMGATYLGAIFGDLYGLRAAGRIAYDLVDGAGVTRVVEAMEESTAPARERKKKGIRVRLAGPTDARFLWELANDRDVRANSFNTGAIPWEDHLSWIEARLSDPSTVLLVAVDAVSNPCGQIRFDVKGHEAELNYSLAREARGKGFGATLIESGLHYLFRNSNVGRVNALVKVENIASLVTFERAGWVREKDVDVRDARCARFTRTRANNSTEE
jgi:UDP-2,4-diacetamido-2,4,6-trideoxy-beta-L-altropyranose hydrolase